MSKLIQAFHLLQNDGFYLRKPLVSLIVSSHDRPFSSTPNNSVLADYLIASLKLSKDKALSFSSRYSRTKSLENPQQVVRFFRALGFSDARIHSIARAVPCILFADVANTLKPKVTLLQQLGLCNLIFKNPSVLTISPQRTLMPAVNLIKKVLVSDGRCRSKEQVNGYLLRVLTRCSTIFYMTTRLEANILFLESRGIVGSQLSSLLLSRTRLFALHLEKLEELVSRAADMNLFALHLEKLEELVSRAADMNFNMGSRMFAHAIAVLGCSSIKTLNGKLEVLRVFEFSKDEIESMFNKWPYILGLSETNLRCKLEFFLNNLKINRSMLVQNPILLSFSITERVIPRYKVLEILKSRKLVSKDLSLITAMSPRTRNSSTSIFNPLQMMPRNCFWLIRIDSLILVKKECECNVNLLGMIDELSRSVYLDWIIWNSLRLLSILVWFFEVMNK